MRISIALCLVFASFQIINAQKIINFKFEIVHKVVFDSMTHAYAGFEYEYGYKRIYLSDSIFIERGLFSKDSIGTTDTFKISHNQWYVKVKNKWKTFWVDKTKNKAFPFLLLSNKKFKILWVNKVHLLNKDLFVFQLSSDIKNIPSNVNYYFDPFDGVLGFEVDNFVLLRTDIIRSK